MIHIGTSGYSYPEWRGSFYPADLPTSQMLGYYAARFSTVEINNTFYRLPSEKVLAEWAHQTPPGFVLTLKAPRRITHEARLRECEELMAVLCARAQTLGPKLGVLLFQLPPWFKKDLEVLDAFLDLMPSDVRAAFEFRNASWLGDDVYARLRAKNLALCIADTADATTPLVPTADYGYFRLRDEGYRESDMGEWAGTIIQRGRDWKDVFVYFKHEQEGKGAEFAQLLAKMISQVDLPSAGPPS
jgi:uncharacterized protein YecE (DUF72 family)